MEFNFTQLKNVYSEALRSPDRSLAFDISNGKGRFLFMMFLSSEDKDAKDNLFIYMRNTRKILKLKTYGSHKKGNFTVYLDDKKKKELICELKLERGSNKSFDFEHFLNELNSAIPQTLSMNTKTNTLRHSKNIIQTLNVLDEGEKSVLIGLKHLSDGKKPQDKTLRKLYLYTNNSPDEIDTLISLLKSTNNTLMWTTEDNNYRAAELSNLINKLNKLNN